MTLQSQRQMETTGAGLSRCDLNLMVILRLSSCPTLKLPEQKRTHHKRGRKACRQEEEGCHTHPERASSG